MIEPLDQAIKKDSIINFVHRIAASTADQMSDNDEINLPFFNKKTSTIVSRKPSALCIQTFPVQQIVTSTRSGRSILST